MSPGIEIRAIVPSVLPKRPFIVLPLQPGLGLQFLTLKQTLKAIPSVYAGDITETEIKSDLRQEEPVPLKRC